MKNLRNYTEFQVLKNVSNPVMFLGLPMKLALIFLAVIMVACFLAMIMKTMDVGLIVNIAVPGGFAFFGITLVRSFYKRYGLKGFSMTQRNRKLADKVHADKTVQQILTKK